MIMLVISFVVASRVSVGYSTFNLQYIGQQAAEISLQSAGMWGRGCEGWVRVCSARPLPEVYFMREMFGNGRKWNFCPLMRTFTRVRMCTIMERFVSAFY